MKFKIELLSVGRNKVCKDFVQSFKTLTDACEFALRECEKNLMSRDVSLIPDTDDEALWSVYAGFHSVGKVRITRMMFTKKNDELLGVES